MPGLPDQPPPPYLTLECTIANRSISLLSQCVLAGVGLAVLGYMFSYKLYFAPTGQDITGDGILLTATMSLFALLALGPLVVVAAGRGKDWLSIETNVLATKRSSWAFWILPIVLDLVCCMGGAVALYVSHLHQHYGGPTISSPCTDLAPTHHILVSIAMITFSG